MEEKRICNQCKQEKPLSGFPVHKTCKKGRMHTCKDCVNKRNRKHREDTLTKFCPKCAKTKPIADFALTPRGIRRKLCIDCYERNQNDRKTQNEYDRIKYGEVFAERYQICGRPISFRDFTK